MCYTKIRMLYIVESFMLTLPLLYVLILDSDIFRGLKYTLELIVYFKVYYEKSSVTFLFVLYLYYNL